LKKRRGEKKKDKGKAETPPRVIYRKKRGKEVGFLISCHTLTKKKKGGKKGKEVP